MQPASGASKRGRGPRTHDFDPCRVRIVECESHNSHRNAQRPPALHGKSPRGQPAKGGVFVDNRDLHAVKTGAHRMACNTFPRPRVGRCPFPGPTRSPDRSRSSHGAAFATGSSFFHVPILGIAVAIASSVIVIAIVIDRGIFWCTLVAVDGWRSVDLSDICLGFLWARVTDVELGPVRWAAVDAVAVDRDQDLHVNQVPKNAGSNTNKARTSLHCLPSCRPPPFTFEFAVHVWRGICVCLFGWAWHSDATVPDPRVSHARVLSS